MLRETYARPALLFNAAVLAGISTILALALYSIPQQVLRQGLNDPQIQLAGDMAARLEQGATVGLLHDHAYHRHGDRLAPRHVLGARD